MGDWVRPEEVATLRRGLAEGDGQVLEELGATLAVYGLLLSPDRRDQLDPLAALREVAARRQSRAREAYARPA